jgi:hypothetical protein
VERRRWRRRRRRRRSTTMMIDGVDNSLPTSHEQEKEEGDSMATPVERSRLVGVDTAGEAWR